MMSSILGGELAHSTEKCCRCVGRCRPSGQWAAATRPWTLTLTYPGPLKAGGGMRMGRRMGIDSVGMHEIKQCIAEKKKVGDNKEAGLN